MDMHLNRETVLFYNLVPFLQEAFGRSLYFNTHPSREMVCIQSFKLTMPGLCHPGRTTPEAFAGSVLLHPTYGNLAQLKVVEIYAGAAGIAYTRASQSHSSKFGSRIDNTQSLRIMIPFQVECSNVVCV